MRHDWRRMPSTELLTIDPRCVVLVLARKKNDEIFISDNIIVKIIEISGNTVRLGIQCPRDIPVLRGELVGQRTQEFTLPLSRFMVPQPSLQILKAG